MEREKEEERKRERGRERPFASRIHSVVRRGFRNKERGRKIVRERQLSRWRKRRRKKKK